MSVSHMITTRRTRQILFRAIFSQRERGRERERAAGSLFPVVTIDATLLMSLRVKEAFWSNCQADQAET